MIVDMFTTIKTEFNKRKIGPEILEWITGPGRQAFEEFLSTLAEEYSRFVKRERQKAAPRPVPLIAEVDLDADPVLPFDGAKLSKHQKQGKVRVEYRPDEDELYVNGKKIVPWLSKEQVAGSVIKGTILQQEAYKNNPLNATLADWLYGNQGFIPKKWQGRAWYFWSSEWCDFDGDRYVRCLDWGGSRWYRDFDWLEFVWIGSEPSASLAS